MRRNPTYLPKSPRRRRRRIRYHVLIPFLLLCGLLVYAPFGIYQTFFKKTPVDTQYTVCGLTSKESKALLMNTNSDQGIIEVKDHLFYAEHLGLYANPYEKGVSDPLVNRSILFRNLCTQEDELEESFVYLMGMELDKKIPLYELTPGYYEVLVSSLMKEERVFMSEIVEDEFYTITRNGKNYKITLMANPKMYYPDDEEFLLDRPYLYVEVKEDVLPADYYDVIVDAGHNTNDLGPIVERGHGANGLVESEENLKASLIIKEELEKAGLKVKLTREGDEVVDTYDVGGRVEMVFKHRAKYYISSHLNALDDKRVSGSEVFYSSYTSSTLAESVLSALITKTDLKASGNIGKGNPIPSVLPTSRIRGYDDLMMIREPGGRALGAGEISELAQTKNGPFIQGTNYGAQAILIEYVYISNTNDANKWKKNYDAYARAAASGIIDYLKLDINAHLAEEKKP